MEWQLVVALVIAAPFILLPVLYVWGVLVGAGAYQAMRGERPPKRKEAATPVARAPMRDMGPVFTKGR